MHGFPWVTNHTQIKDRLDGAGALCGKKKTKKLPWLLSLSETVGHYSMVNTYIINWTRFANSDSRST
jgi:hypothetical protein